MSNNIMLHRHIVKTVKIEDGSLYDLQEQMALEIASLEEEGFDVVSCTPVSMTYRDTQEDFTEVHTETGFMLIGRKSSLL